MERRSIEIEGGVIRGLHRGDASPSVSADLIDGAGMMAAPGLVNAHTHSPDNLARGSVANLPLELWSLQSATARERRSTREIHVSALLGAIEMLRTGTTTVLDHVRISPDIDGAALDAVAEAYQAIGMRAIIAPVVADRPVVATMPFQADDLDGLDLSRYGARPTMQGREQIAIAEAFIRRWHGVEGRISGAIGPSAPQRCTDDLLVAAGDLSTRLNVLFHTHALETSTQKAMGRQLYGKGIVAHLAELDLLNSRTNLAHAIWLDDGDIGRLAESQASVIHNPVSNARLGSGFCPLPALLRNGVRVALGTDSACCNDSNNLIETAKWASLLHNLVTPDPDQWIDAGTSLWLATAGGAEALGLGSTVGRLAVGARADITLLKLASPSFVPLIDPVRQLVQAENGAAVDRVLVAGETVVQDGRCVRVDEEALWLEAQDLANRRIRDNRSVGAEAALLEQPIRRMHARLGRHAVSYPGNCCP